MSGELLDKLSCRSKTGRELWAPTSALIFLADGE
jgi:hypothetical protein